MKVIDSGTLHHRVTSTSGMLGHVRFSLARTQNLYTSSAIAGYFGGTLGWGIGLAYSSPHMFVIFPDPEGRRGIVLDRARGMAIFRLGKLLKPILEHIDVEFRELPMRLDYRFIYITPPYETDKKIIPAVALMRKGDRPSIFRTVKRTMRYA